MSSEYTTTERYAVPATSFPQFMALPIELRYMIWSCTDIGSREPRILPIAKYMRSGGFCSRVRSDVAITTGDHHFFKCFWPTKEVTPSEELDDSLTDKDGDEISRVGPSPRFFYRAKTNLPETMLTCKESLQVACKFFTPCISRDGHFTINWFSYERDTLFIPKGFWLSDKFGINIARELKRMGFDMSRLERVAIERAPYELSHSEHRFRIKNMLGLRKLKEFIFVPELRDKLETSWKAPRMALIEFGDMWADIEVYKRPYCHCRSVQLIEELQDQGNHSRELLEHITKQVRNFYIRADVAKKGISKRRGRSHVYVPRMRYCLLEPYTDIMLQKELRKVWEKERDAYLMRITVKCPGLPQFIYAANVTTTLADLIKEFRRARDIPYNKQIRLHPRHTSIDLDVPVLDNREIFHNEILEIQVED